MPCLQGPSSKTDADGAASQRYVDIEIGTVDRVKGAPSRPRKVR
jgi:hypothetical protein